MVSHPPRLANFTYVGKYSYFLTFCTHERRRRFIDPDTVSLVHSQLLQCSLKHSVAIHVYCAMPDHMHVLAAGLTEGTDARAFMSEFKQHTGWQFRCLHGQRLWQGSYYDHVLRPEEGIDGVIAYIVENPVRAGLVTTPEEYPYWDSFTQTRSGLLEFIKGAGEWRPDRVGQPVKGRPTVFGQP